MSINEKIIVSVFHELVKYKPKLAILLPDEEEEEETDLRQLAAEIIGSFPWPLGVELRRLFSAGLNELSRGRLDQILKTVERITQFISFIFLSQILEESIRRQISFPEDLQKNFVSRFSVPSLGTYIWLIQSLSKVFSTNEIEPFVPEMNVLLSKQFQKKLQPWTPIRNEISHYLVNLNDEEIQTRCYEYQEELTDLLVDLCFLAKYPLVTVTDIRVNKRKRKPVTYNHEIKILNNISSDFAGRRREYGTSSDNQSVLLVKNLKIAPEEYLSLSPFIVDTHTEILDSPEKIKNIRKDIFLYTKWERSTIHYVGTEARERSDLRSLSYYDLLVEELNEYFTCFSS